MSELKFTVRTADQTRRATIELEAGRSAQDVLDAAADNWALPADSDYSLVNVTTGRVVAPGERLADAVSSGDVLEVQPVLVAGA